MLTERSSVLLATPLANLFIALLNFLPLIVHPGPNAKRRPILPFNTNASDLAAHFLPPADSLLNSLMLN